MLREDAKLITEYAIRAVLPDEAVRRALQNEEFPGRVFLVAAGKAAWRMAKAAHESLGDRIVSGVVITKYGHAEGDIPGIVCHEGGHPVPDENGIRGTREALDLVTDLKADDTVVFLLSGGGSALFEQPLIPLSELQKITEQLLAGGANIVEINTVRKRLSLVKGGRFAKACAPARVFSVVLSDIIGDPLDMIASGPAYPDTSTCDDARKVAEKYALSLSVEARRLLSEETPKELSHVKTVVTGSVRELCAAAAKKAEELGYRAEILTTEMDCEAREAGRLIGSVARSHANDGTKRAFIFGGETVVHVTGSGKGGRNQELALAAAGKIAGLPNTVVFSVGSDGTDGPTDAAGGIVDGTTAERLKEQGISVFDALKENDAYTALASVDGLVKTGATGTNVNDVAVLLTGG